MGLHDAEPGELKLLGGHVVQTADPGVLLYVPAGQVLQLVLPVGLYCPMRQAMGAVSPTDGQ